MIRELLRSIPNKWSYNGFYLRWDWTIITGLNFLIGFYSQEGYFQACTDTTLKDCIVVEYSEFQIGIFLFSIAFGKENVLKQTDEQRDI